MKSHLNRLPLPLPIRHAVPLAIPRTTTATTTYIETTQEHRTRKRQPVPPGPVTTATTATRGSFTRVEPALEDNAASFSPAHAVSIEGIGVV